MKMCRELSDEEIENLGEQFNPNDWATEFNYKGFAAALFKAAEVKQTQERDPECLSLKKN